ncbi:hypothetical protein GJAV_G00021840 [Gymnothorax javanicus]|nr:hypothetical protein GJAV_G00021840 [Gymnothorax javanicus]
MWGNDDNTEWPSSQPKPDPVWPSAPPPQQREKPKVPFGMNLPQGSRENMLITIKGQVKAHPNRFIVDILKNKEIAFHFNPRFNEGGKKVIVRNSMLEGKWGSSERDLSGFPFSPGEEFELRILCKHDKFMVAVDKKHLLEFKHRIDCNSITGLGVYGDVSLHSDPEVTFK